MTAMQAVFSQVGITLPIGITIAIAAWLQSKRLGGIRDDIRDIRAEIRDIRTELREIKDALRDLGRRVTALEERTRPIVRG